MDLLEWMEKNKSKSEKSDKALLTDGRKACILVGAVCLVLVFLGVMYAGRCREIYFWDDATYWEMGRSVVSGELKGDFWHRVYESIGTSDYNYLAALPSALWMWIFGTSRLSYVTGLIVMYIIPSSVLTYRLCAKLSKAPWVSYIAATFMLPATLYLTGLGFVDVGGFLIALACYNLYYTGNEKCGMLRYVGIGVMLILMMLFRRYFAFFAVSFVTAMIIDCILFHRKWTGLIVTGITSALIMLLGFVPFLTGILLKDYGTLYSGYKFALMVDLRFIARYFGALFIIVLFAVPFIAAIKKKDYRPIFPWVQNIVCGTMFIATQTHGQQHLLMYVPAFTVLSIFLVNCISKRWMLFAVTLLVIVTAISPYIDRKQPSNIQEIKNIAIIPSFSMKPVVRDDVTSVIAVKRKLDSFIPEGSQCNVLASSFTINDSILRNAEPSLGIKINRDADYIRSLPEVDSRDNGRLNEIYSAEYILVAVPSQTHLAPGAQTIVDEAVASFVNRTDISQIFEEIEDFRGNIDDIELRLYHRTADIDAIRQAEFESRLYYTVE
ncbi:MAG: hypothetical protein J1G06_03460 [Oscillospiraceae bacterium]|nr:hypothetical protein [Oscillospiraceae bacterium]